ncbi:sugar metabolism protein [Aestuariibacter sp. A3R04]|uniref:sugar metabolism protein n=1 Tax=Aestuariibacter sp. A3R04 TaxID=2841571 RepID=UPI001C09D3F0|nr:sugar metabolism protein [Aestuariibacter sp. A3R04]MBU3021981.1 sugar metabolism protein [Aestuariibacter sp. A3R04]
MSLSTFTTTGKSVTFCGCGWLGQHFARQSTDWTIAGTTRSKDKARLLKTLGVTPLIYALGDDPHRLTSSLAHNNLVLNIPPGRKGSIDSDFVNHVTKLVDTLLLSSTQRLIFISTTSVFGKREGLVSENSERAPDTASGKAHCEIEDHLLAKQDARISVLRLSGLIGQDRHPIKFLAGKELVNGGQPVNLVHVDDVITALKNVLTQKLETRQPNVFHLCSTVHPTRKAYYTEAARQFSLPSPIFNDEAGVNSKVIDCHSSLKKLGLSLKYASPYGMLPDCLSE